MTLAVRPPSSEEDEEEEKQEEEEEGAQVQRGDGDSAREGNFGEGARGSGKK